MKNKVWLVSLGETILLTFAVLYFMGFVLWRLTNNKYDPMTSLFIFGFMMIVILFLFLVIGVSLLITMFYYHEKYIFGIAITAFLALIPFVIQVPELYLALVPHAIAGLLGVFINSRKKSSQELLK